MNVEGLSYLAVQDVDTRLVPSALNTNVLPHAVVEATPQRIGLFWTNAWPSGWLQLGAIAPGERGAELRVVGNRLGSRQPDGTPIRVERIGR